MNNIIYLFDPLCGWCYGASKGLDTLIADPSNRVRLLPTGLFSRTGRIMDAEMAEYAWRNDQKIAALTGAAFSANYREKVLGAHGEPFDSHILIQALTAVAQTAPERETEALKALQAARYTDGKNIVSHEDAAEVLNRTGLSEAAALFGSATLAADTDARIAEGKALAVRHGISGVPALLTETEHGWQQADSRTLFR